MNRYLGAIIGVVTLMLVFSTSAFAGNPESFNVTVSIASAADITVIQGGPVAFGTMSTGSLSVSGSAIVIRNTGTGSSQTYSLSLTDPDWTAVATSPGFNEYRLCAVFDTDGAGITWEPLNHALTTSSVAASATQFAGDETGTGVAYDADRHIWLRMETPSSTDLSGLQTIAVTITAAVD